MSLCLAAAAVLVSVSSETARAGAAPSCAGADDREFPLSTRIRGGPASYTAGGGFGTWYIDLTNTTDRSCADIHPVVVLVDSKRALKPAQPQLEFYDSSRARPVRFAATDEHELVGAFDGDDFAGFTVAPGRTVSVKVRLAVTSDAVPDDITANAAVVQRHEEDGDWVGESNDYRFRVADGRGEKAGEGQVDGSGTAAPESSSSGSPDGSETPGGASSAPDTGTAPTPTGSALASAGSALASAGETDGTDGTGKSDSAEAAGNDEEAEELAGTGLAVAHAAGTVFAGLLAAGGSVYVLVRRRR
ncbi:hypothetical protein GCM10010121_030700 [Streptomyces brasiliensis]|uniref:Gram-positive cocci surface proteins LPxTG domain-containing protein n=1 Tax=Streptomyces brasiliensis TaxID=1954 RepID=A0A917KLJ6_9ACTN|nr:hypothetical protein GCM10010121_030700 [Streptomyces brasiliensis]